MARPELGSVLPPLILGTATFNTQYHPDPEQMPYTDIVRRALQHNITAFDTSPYYGPSETLLGQALSTIAPSRGDLFLITKAGRIASDDFDYSPAWIRYSVCRSLERLRTSYLDLVYAHDVEFVSPEEVLEAVRELRRLRDRGIVRYVGISGYPLDVLASLAEMILSETGEPLDAILSYANYTVQNDRLGQEQHLKRFGAARVGCLLNASILGMGLLTTRGIDKGPMASWHPAPPELRTRCSDLAVMAEADGERLEEIAIRWALKNWASVGAPFGTRVPPSGPCLSSTASAGDESSPRIGVSVMGVSAVTELEETWKVWKSVMGSATAADNEDASRQEGIARLVDEVMRPSLESWRNYAWKSGGNSFINSRAIKGIVPKDDGIAERGGINLSAAAIG